MGKQISENRKAAYYIGMILIVVGFVLFFSVLFEGVSSVSNGPSFGPGGLQDSGPNPATALIGMVLVVVGGILRSVGARGLAGSGAILDPEQAKEELEPYSRAAGGMAKDFLEEAVAKHAAVYQDRAAAVKQREALVLAVFDQKIAAAAVPAAAVAPPSSSAAMGSSTSMAGGGPGPGCAASPTLAPLKP